MPVEEIEVERISNNKYKLVKGFSKFEKLKELGIVNFLCWLNGEKVNIPISFIIIQ